MPSRIADTAAAATASEDSEFERSPVPDTHLKGARSFVGMYAGEHVAGTEFMIGPLFVAHGVSAFDLLVGLLLGNTLAVLCWRFLCAPIAVRRRLTLYFHLEKIVGPKLVVLYNLANGVMFCFLAGAMIAVSATAVGVPLDMPMPKLSDMYPTSLAWVLAVFGVGAVIAVVAAKGYDMVAKFADMCAPWMVLVFLACGLAALPQLGVKSFDGLWDLANASIWTGKPLAGQSKFGFWHIAFFGWFANMAMHIGMADLSILRFARKPSSAYAAGVGMFVGHYMAWIAASLLYAVQLKNDPSNTAVAPGPMAYGVTSWAGILCVIFAGWTTANPTIYRAGLAFQTLLPRLSRAQVTLVAGAVSTVAALFPALVMKLLDFVALYGLILMPMGAVILLDFWVLPRFGLKSDLAEVRRLPFNWAAAAAWILSLALCLALVQWGGVEIFFVALPGWFLAAIIYIVASKIYQRGFVPA